MHHILLANRISEYSTNRPEQFGNSAKRTRSRTAECIRTYMSSEASVQQYGKPKCNGYIAIDTNSDNIRVLELSKQKDHYQVENLICETIDPKDNKNIDKNSEKTVEQRIKNIIERHNLKSHDAAVAISYSGIMIKNIPLTHNIDETELEEFLALNIEQYINVAADKISFDYRTATTKYNNHNQTTLELIAAYKENIDKNLALMEEIGLKTAVIDADAYALSRAANLLDTILDLSQPYALINIEKKKTLIMIVEQNILIHAQEHFIENCASSDAHTLATQITTNLQLCLATTNQHINNIVLCGSHANTSGLTETLHKISHIKTRLANPFSNMTFANHLNQTEVIQKASAMMLCCGLSMWEKSDFNLLPWRQKLRNKKQQRLKKLVIVNAILGFIIIGIWHFTLQQKINSAITMQHELLPNLAAAEQQEQQLKTATNKITAIKTKLNEIKNLQNNQTKSTELLTILSKITPSALYLSHLQKNSDKVIIEGQTTNLNAITEFIQNIIKTSLFTQSQIQEIKNISEQEHTFTITATL